MQLIDVTSFRLPKTLYSPSVLLKRTNNFGSVLANIFDYRVYETKFPIHVSFLFSIFYMSYNFTFSLDAKNLPFIVAVATLSR
jgi:hypothetical protein